jgi:hypothetical protein
MDNKKLAVDCFNGTWDLIDKTDRSETDTLKMIHMAHTSRYHWGEIGTPLEWSRGEWQISRVYSLANLGESALYHGRHALNYCLENNIGDFDLAFAYEAIARAYAVLGNDSEKEVYFEKAKEASKNIVKESDRDYFMSELGKIKPV